MIPYEPQENTTVIVYDNGEFIGQRYGKWNNLDQIKTMVKQNKWMNNQCPTRIAVVKNHYKVELEIK